MRISDWSSERVLFRSEAEGTGIIFGRKSGAQADEIVLAVQSRPELIVEGFISHAEAAGDGKTFGLSQRFLERPACVLRSEEHTSELQSLMRISYAVFSLKKKKTYNTLSSQHHQYCIIIIIIII